MPTVPMYQRQVAQAPLPTVRGDQNAASGAFATAQPVDLSGVARVAQQIHEEDLQKNNAMVVNAAERQLGDLRTSLLFDPETGAIAKRGHAALGAIDDVQQRWQEGVAKIRESFKLNGDTDRAFAQREQGYWATLNEQVQSHTAAELKKQDVEDTGDLLKKGLDAVSQDPANADSQVEIAKARLKDFAARNGWSPVELEQKTAAHVSDIHAAAISRLVALGTPEAAQQASAYLTAHRKELVGAQLDDAEKLVDEGVAQGAGLRAADAILGIGPAVLPDTTQAKAAAATGQEDAAPTPGPATSMVDALARAERIPDPKQRKAATDAIVAHFTHLEQAKRIERESATERVMQAMEANGGRLNRASPDYQLLIGHPEQEHVLHRQEQLLHPKDPGDPEAFMQALSLASLPTGRSEFLRMNFAGKDGQGLSIAQKTHLINLQRQYSGGGSSSHAVTAAQADAAHWHRVAETESLKGPQADADKITEALRLAHIAETKAQQLQRAPIADAATIPFHDFGASSATSGDVDLRDPKQPLAGILSPVAAHQPTQAMIDRVARDRASGQSAYEDYLRGLGVVLPKVLHPTTAPAKR